MYYINSAFLYVILKIRSIFLMLPVLSIKKIIYFAILLCLLNIYFAIHLFTGSNSLIAYSGLKNAMKKKTQDLNQIKIKNDELDAEISLLRGKIIDLDYLEELARSKLNYSYPDEIVIIYGKSDNNSQ